MLGITFLADGILLVVIYEVAIAIINNQATKASESLAREAIPIAAHPLLHPIMTIGIPELVLGVLLVVVSFVKALHPKNT